MSSQGAALNQMKVVINIQIFPLVLFIIHTGGTVTQLGLPYSIRGSWLMVVASGRKYALFIKRRARYLDHYLV